LVLLLVIVLEHLLEHLLVLGLVYVLVKVLLVQKEKLLVEESVHVLADWSVLLLVHL